MSIAAYCQDYDEFMPIANTFTTDADTGYHHIWIAAIYPYIAGCAWDGGSLQYSPRTLAKCQSPSTCAVIIDGKAKTSDAHILWDVTSPTYASMYLADRHGDGLNVLYADNHVKWFNKKSASQTEIDKTFKWGGTSQTDWPY